MLLMLENQIVINVEHIVSLVQKVNEESFLTNIQYSEDFEKIEVPNITYIKLSDNSTITSNYTPEQIFNKIKSVSAEKCLRMAE